MPLFLFITSEIMIQTRKGAAPLVVLGTERDPHVARVAASIRSMGGEVHIIDYLARTAFSLTSDQTGSPTLTIAGKKIDSDYVVWDKTKIIEGTALYLDGPDDYADYGSEEWKALSTLMAGLKGLHVINSLESRKCRIKPYQQLLAGNCGFRVPTSIVSNCKNSLLEFHDAVGNQVIMKSLSGVKVRRRTESGTHHTNIMTMGVDRDDLQNSDKQNIEYCPNFLQVSITKSHELRIIIAGQRLIAFKVDSQSRPGTSVDWRKGLNTDQFSRTQLSDDLRSKVLSFMARIGLATGSMDLIIDTKGTPWFLECNQDGAWAWLDDLVNGEITEAFAELLLDLATRRSTAAECSGARSRT